ncbi:hypothetical protein [Kribbella sp. NPDC051770]|uniref:hypothetical protein n=1 Tax=Kribbella sp. NPDC051770 TaxID=3155413 RepID=UPI0034203FEE
MAASDEVFLASDAPLADVAARVAVALGLEHMGVVGAELQYRARGRSFDGWIGVFIGPNDHYPEPGEVQAMDRYPVLVDIQSRRLKETQPEEARLAFEVLTRELPDVPALLSHNLEQLVAASRPGVGMHYFGDGVWLDPPEVEPWAPWVLLGED